MTDIDFSDEQLAAAELVKALCDKAFEAGKLEGRVLGYREGVEASRINLAALSTVPLFAMAIEDQEKAASKPLDTQIEDLMLSVRAYNSLMREDLRTIRDVLAKSQEDLLDIRNLGSKCVEEIRSRLAEIGYYLRTN
jgi:DNA-directed RNA polymerase alpha subunit